MLGIAALSEINPFAVAVLDRTAVCKLVRDTPNFTTNDEPRKFLVATTTVLPALPYLGETKAISGTGARKVMLKTMNTSGVETLTAYMYVVAVPALGMLGV
jgi:hypothetical protein